MPLILILPIKKQKKEINMTFDLQYTDPKSNARAGLITTDHGQ